MYPARMVRTLILPMWGSRVVGTASIDINLKVLFRPFPLSEGVWQVFGEEEWVERELGKLY